MAKVIFNAFQIFYIMRFDQINRCAMFICPTGTANTMNIVITAKWQIVVYDMSNIRYIQTPGSNIGGYRDLDLAGAEFTNPFTAYRLIKITM